MSIDTAAITDIAIGIDDIKQAAERLAPWVHRTPVMTSKALDRALWMLGVPQVREPSEGRRVQVPRCDERDPPAQGSRATSAA